MRYIIVLHAWHVDSKGFKIIESNATTRKDAEIQAKVLYADNNRDFNTCAYKIIEISKTERLRKLSIKERISGKLRKIDFFDKDKNNIYYNLWIALKNDMMLFFDLGARWEKPIIEKILGIMSSSDITYEFNKERNKIIEPDYIQLEALNKDLNGRIEKILDK